MEMQPINHHHLHHQHLPFLPHSHPTPTASAVADFDAVFAGVSLQSLLLGEPVLLTPPPPPFPPSPLPAATPIIPHPLQQFRDRWFPPHQPPPNFFFFQAAGAAPSEKKRRHPRRNPSAAAVTHPHAHPQPRRQRQKVSEKLKALRRMVPCDQKADIATMLEQAYRYVRYLEAQVLALLTMKLCPLEERGLFPGGDGGGGESEVERRMAEAVGRLSRKEVVEAVVNSGSAQRVMYEEGLCLVSEEQFRALCLPTFQKQKQQQQQQQQLSGLIGGGAANPGNNNNDSNNSSSSSFSYN